MGQPVEGQGRAVGAEAAVGQPFGNLVFNWKGAYSAATAYVLKDSVSHGGSINKMLCYAENMAPSANRFFHTKNMALSILKYSEGCFSLQTPVELVEYTSVR